MPKSNRELLADPQLAIAGSCEDIKKLCHAFGLRGINRATIILRDSRNDEMGMVITDDEYEDVYTFFRRYIDTKPERRLGEYETREP